MEVIAMMAMEGCTIGLTILAKTSLSGGLSPFVFVAYTNALSFFLILPFLFFSSSYSSNHNHNHNNSQQPALLTFPLLMRFFFLGFIGIALPQNLAFLGLSYTSPIVVCSMGLLLPALSFILSLIFKNEGDWRRSRLKVKVKVLGTLVSIIGATVVELYKGPFIRSSKSKPKSHMFVYLSTTSKHWLLGCMLLAASALCISLFNIIQLATVKQYPNMMKAMSIYTLAGTIQCVFVSLIVEQNTSAWKLHRNMDPLLIVTTAIFCSVIRTGVHIRCADAKGPFYVRLFKPIGIGFATLFGVSFFTNSLHWGSVIGAVISGVGYYVVMWGEIEEEDDDDDPNMNDTHSSNTKVSLLQQDMHV